MTDMLTQKEIDELVGQMLDVMGKTVDIVKRKQSFDYVNVANLSLPLGILKLFAKAEDVVTHFNGYSHFYQEHELMHRFLAANDDIRQKFIEYKKKNAEGGTE